ncbi:unnamed protein product [Paramecium octaurelia]|uniref:Uncharacterized protein n=1 Tax=Paramecium octaurelia TaxID=43137 RepID=A0A8S1UKF3_PAROT|nr:unnamed protein product [Paramecium octaurelia]
MLFSVNLSVKNTEILIDILIIIHTYIKIHLFQKIFLSYQNVRVRFQQDLIEQSNALTDALASQNSAISVQSSPIQTDQLRLGLKKGQGNRCQASEPQPISNNVLESSKSVNILCWNLQGYSYRKYEHLKTSHIILAQEANLIDGKKDYNVYGYQSYIKERIGHPLMTLVRKKILPEESMIQKPKITQCLKSFSQNSPYQQQISTQLVDLRESGRPLQKSFNMLLLQWWRYQLLNEKESKSLL